MAENKENPPAVRNVETTLNPFGAFDPELDQMCCGKPMEPRLVHARNRFGETMFVAVWRCLACNRITH